MPSRPLVCGPWEPAGRDGQRNALSLDQSHAQRSEHGEDPPVVQSARLVQAAATRKRARRAKQNVTISISIFTHSSFIP
jgi:hypothetical protein